MKVLCIDHVAIAVKDLDAAMDHFITQLGAEHIMSSTRTDTLYTAAYMGWGESCFTLVRPDDPKCFVQKDIDRRGEGLHHIGIEVDDLDAFEAHFADQGGVVGPKETIEQVRREFVISPKHNHGVLMQVMEFFPPYKGMKPAKRYAQLAKDGLLHKG